MKITFVNHASFIISSGEVNLICDPWLDGLAFNNGWKLLSETKIKYFDFERITHIWFSHEHPDHFSPPNLLQIPKEIRAKITVLFQETTDHKVANFCKKTGFKEIVELKEDVFFEITKDFSILCNAYTDGDSYAVFKIGDFKILNLNDCVVNAEKNASDIKQKTGEVDLLFTQFAYANKVGNVDDVEQRMAASLEKLRRLAIQNKIFSPRIIVPFASYVYFCHEDNKYMNEGMNKIDRVFRFIQNDLNTECLVMYPGDVWKPNQPWDSSQAIQNYMRDYNEIAYITPVVSELIGEEMLIDNSIQFIKTLREGYPQKSRFIDSLSTLIYISDYKKTFSLSGKFGLVEVKNNYELCDVSISSESLNYCFKELWGFDTLQINARFQILKDYNRFRAFGTIASSLNRKENFPFISLLERVINRVKHSINLRIF